MFNPEDFSDGNTKISFINNLSDFIELANNINKEDILELDSFCWDFTKSQLETVLSNLTTPKEVVDYIKENIDFKDLYHPEVIRNEINKKMIELSEQGVDMTNKTVAASVSLNLENGINRKINFQLIDLEDEEDNQIEEKEEELTNDNRDLPKFNENIKTKIENICKEAFCGILKEEEINDFAAMLCEQYKNEPFTIDFLEGFISGFLSNQ